MRPKPAAAPEASPPRVGPPRLREVVGGYDIDQWPIRVPRTDGESLPGWIRRLANRYGITPRAALTEMGLTPRSQLHPDLSALIGTHPEAFIRAGLDQDSARQVLLTTRTRTRRR